MKCRGLSELDARDLVAHSLACVDKALVLIKCMRFVDESDRPVLEEIAHDQAEAWRLILEDYDQKVA